MDGKTASVWNSKKTNIAKCDEGQEVMESIDRLIGTKVIGYRYKEEDFVYEDLCKFKILFYF